MAEEKGKVSKPSVNYRQATATRRCGTCDMFRACSPYVGSCDLVRGVIEIADVCNEWVVIGSARKQRAPAYQDHKEPKSPGG